MFRRRQTGSAVLLGFLPIRQRVQAKEGGMAVASSAGLVLTVHLTIVPHLQKVQQQSVRLCCLKIVVHTGNERRRTRGERREERGGERRRGERRRSRRREEGRRRRRRRRREEGEER